MLTFEVGDCVRLIGKIVLASDRDRVIFWRGRIGKCVGLLTPDCVDETVFGEMDTLLDRGLTLHLAVIRNFGKLT